MPKCGENKNEAPKAKPSVSLMFLTHFDIFCNLLLYSPHQHGIYWLKKQNVVNGDVIDAFFLQLIIGIKQTKSLYKIQLIVNPPHHIIPVI